MNFASHLTNLGLGYAFGVNENRGTEIKNPDGIHGFKAFDPDWACRPRLHIVKQYTCPGMFETETAPSVCNHGMHFCRRLEDIFEYYNTLIQTVDGKQEPPKVAEVIAWGTVREDGNKCSTNKLEIVREIPWQEVLDRVNTGRSCSGVCNTGNRNTGDWNTGDWNTGNRNTGDWNTGNRNTGNRNTGDWNTGDWNTGNRNTGNRNTGDWNTGNRNTGNRNTGNRNTGDWNTGNRNTGDWNTGNRNTGDWNRTNFSAGCFCTEEPEMLMFNKPSGMTYRQWLGHPARFLLNQIPKNVVEWVYECDMTEEEKKQYPTYETTGGYLKVLDESECAQRWWDGLSWDKQEVILQLPNFNAELFYECSGIRV